MRDPRLAGPIPEPPAANHREARLREPPPIGRRPHQNLRRLDLADRPSSRAPIRARSPSSISITSRKSRYWRAISRADTGSASSFMIFAAGPLTAAPPISGDTAITGAPARTSRSRSPGNRQNRRDAQVGIRRTEHDPLQIGPLERGAHLVRQGRRALGAIAESAHRRGAAMLHEVLLERQTRRARSYRGRRPLIAHRQSSPATPRRRASARVISVSVMPCDLQLAPIQVQRDVAIAQLKPGIDPELTPLAPAPARFRPPGPIPAPRWRRRRACTARCRGPGRSAVPDARSRRRY